MQAFLLTLCALTLAASLAAAAVVLITTATAQKRTRRFIVEHIRAKAECNKPTEKHSDKVRVSNVIQSVTRYTGRSYADVAAELRKYPAEKIGRHWYYDRTQAEAIREIYKPKKSNK